LNTHYMRTNYNPNLVHTQTQQEAILEHLLTGSELNGLDAFRYYGTMKLASRISEIKKMCFPVSSDWVTLENGKKVKVYKMK
jgi:hypothetical protein